MGKPKGLKQVLYERGVYSSGMKVQELKEVMRNALDFKKEIGIIEQIIVDSGHLLIMSPKCHPELAGLGIEYDWGKSKAAFRRFINDYVPSHLCDNVLKSFDPELLPVVRVRRYARKTRDYMHVYEKISNETTQDLESETFKKIERMMKTYKCHRNILDIERATIYEL